MSGRYLRLEPGRYTLHVSEGEGPAGVRRTDEEEDVRVGVDGGQVEFRVGRREDVYFWWRGPRERPGVRLLGVARGGTSGGAERRTLEGPWPKATTG